jgi:VCBS repeat protein
MRFGLLIFAFVVAASTAQADDWQLQTINAPARVSAIDTVGGQVRVMSGGLWYALKRDKGKFSLDFIDSAGQDKLPEGALPNGQVATGKHDVARAWFAEPTDRYDHDILGSKMTAGALVIELRDGRRQVVRVKPDAVFEDLKPRIVDLSGNGDDDIIVVKSYLKRGSALALVAERKGRYDIVAETPPLGATHRWLDPVAVADFTGDGKPDIALVRQPHAVGALELWSWRDDRLQKTAELPNVANHIAGTRAIDMAAVADFDADHVADIAIPSLDRTHLRILSFSPQPRELGNVALPAKAATNLGVFKDDTAPAVALGLEDGSLVVVQHR